MSPSLSLSPGVPSGVVLISLPPLLLVPAIGTGYLLPSSEPRQASARETRTTQASPTRLTNHAIASSVHRHFPAQRRDTYCYQHHASLQTADAAALLGFATNHQPDLTICRFIAQPEESWAKTGQARQPGRSWLQIPSTFSLYSAAQ
ncbi:hypothetical protein K456DRAFT_1213211 [Colletotrichum gloeosporioides 23]|nr:hypothetical protein K456DRAFT_1213211 [Colletotrichum gloeosporioides 23]